MYVCVCVSLSYPFFLCWSSFFLRQNTTFLLFRFVLHHVHVVVWMVWYDMMWCSVYNVLSTFHLLHKWKSHYMLMPFFSSRPILLDFYSNRLFSSTSLILSISNDTGQLNDAHAFAFFPLLPFILLLSLECYFSICIQKWCEFCSFCFHFLTEIKYKWTKLFWQ